MHTQILRVVIAEVQGRLLQLGFLLDDFASEAGDHRIPHDLGQRVAGTARFLFAAGVAGLRLHPEELGGKFAQFGGFGVEPLVVRDYAFLLLVGGQLCLGFFQIVAQRLALLAEPAGILARRIDFQFDGDIDVSLRKRVGDCRGECRIGSYVRYVDDIAVARGGDTEPLEQKLGEPGLLRTFASGGAHPLVPHRRALVEPQRPDDLPRHAVTADDVHLRGKAGRHDHGHYRVRGPHVYQYGRRGGVLFRQQQIDCQRTHCGDKRHYQRDFVMRPENKQKLQRSHGAFLRTGFR